MTTTDITRETVPAMDDMIGKTFNVLDKGHIRVIDYMGSDAAIVQAARVSYGKGTKTVSEDRGLIRYLMRHRHTTPFEMCELKLHVRVPMDHWRQWIRHRTASVNEYSTRYSEAIDDKQVTLPGQWRFQSGTNKQGSGENLPREVGANLSDGEHSHHAAADSLYQQRLKCGVAREQARKDLPLSTYTEAYWKIDLHNLLHFLSLRMDSHAQQEIREYATIIGQHIVKNWVPHTWEAFVDYRLEAVTFSRPELEALKALFHSQGLKEDILEDGTSELMQKISGYGWMEREPTTSKLKGNRERQEFVGKLSRLGLEMEDVFEQGFTLAPPPAGL